MRTLRSLAVVVLSACGATEVSSNGGGEVSVAQSTLAASFSLGTSAISAGVTKQTMTASQTQMVDRLKQQIADVENNHKAGPANPPPPVVTAYPRAPFSRMASMHRGMTSFDGLGVMESAAVNWGGYGEPTDHALCTGNGYVVQALNGVVGVYSASTGRLVAGPMADFSFLKVKPFFDPETGAFGDGFLSDPGCLYDAQTGHFFVTYIEILVALDPTGQFLELSGTRVLVASSKTSDPTKEWTIQGWDASHDGLNGTPGVCLGDFPRIGSNQDGLFVSTNAFCFGQAGFNFDVQLYGVGKRALLSGAPRVVRVGGLPLLGGVAPSTVIPATQPPQEEGERAARGTAYFVGSVDTGEADAEGLGDKANQIAIYAMRNTASLDTASPSVTVGRLVLTTQPYAMPVPATQKDGPHPYGESLGYSVPRLDTIDNRIGQTTFADHKLYFAMNTAIADGPGALRTGIAYFIVEVAAGGPNGLKGELHSQGYINVAGQHAMFPSMVVNAQGHGAMVFGVAGPDFFPSVGYSIIDGESVGAVHVAAVGAAPDDGFTGYLLDSTGAREDVARWGDYSAGGVAEDGSVWLGMGYIPNGPRLDAANFGTRVIHLDHSALGE